MPWFSPPALQYVARFSNPPPQLNPQLNPWVSPQALQYVARANPGYGYMNPPNALPPDWQYALNPDMGQRILEAARRYPHKVPEWRLDHMQDQVAEGDLDSALNNLVGSWGLWALPPDVQQILEDFEAAASNPGPPGTTWHAGGSHYYDGDLYQGAGRYHHHRRHPETYHPGGGTRYHGEWHSGGGHYERNPYERNGYFPDLPLPGQRHSSSWDPEEEERYERLMGSMSAISDYELNPWAVRHTRQVGPFRTRHQAETWGAEHGARGAPAYLYKPNPGCVENEDRSQSCWYDNPAGAYNPRDPVRDVLESADWYEWGDALGAIPALPAGARERARRLIRDAETAHAKGNFELTNRTNDELYDALEPFRIKEKRPWWKFWTNPPHHLEPRHDVLCQCGWGQLGMPESEIPLHCPVCAYPIGHHAHHEDNPYVRAGAWEAGMLGLQAAQDRLVDFEDGWPPRPWDAPWTETSDTIGRARGQLARGVRRNPLIAIVGNPPARDNACYGLHWHQKDPFAAPEGLFEATHGARKRNPKRRGKYFTRSRAIEGEHGPRIVERPWAGGTIKRTLETSKQHKSRMKGIIKGTAKREFGANLRDSTINAMLGKSRAELAAAGKHRLAKIKARADNIFYAQTRSFGLLPGTKVQKTQLAEPAKKPRKKAAKKKAAPKKRRVAGNRPTPKSALRCVRKKNSGARCKGRRLPGKETCVFHTAGLSPKRKKRRKKKAA